jgi:hypothetical protein
MTEESRSGPVGPPWSVDVLADLHAGALDSALSAQLWPRVNADPEARAVIEALDTVKVELGQLGAAPAAPMPAHLAARFDAALRTELYRTATAPPPTPPGAAPVVDLAEARRRRNRRTAWGVGLLTAAAAAIAVTVAVLPGQGTSGNPVAAIPGSNSANPPLPVDSGNLSAAIGGVNSQRDYGPLKDQQGLDKCIEANGIDPSSVQTLGVRQVMLDGKRGVFALLTTGRLGQFRVLIVEPTCGPGNPGRMVNTLLPS